MIPFHHHSSPPRRFIASRKVNLFDGFKRVFKINYF